ncbi:hypothetical protein MMC07_007696 [Pseudocyphellaria aurata]|nr:hypothetical protein [Pseudocyphellaria aurata]
MSFGFSVGDIAALGQLAWRVYKACKDAPDSFKNISQEVSSLSMVLKEVEEALSNSGLSAPQQSRLKFVGEGCRVILEDLQSRLDKHNSLSTKSKRTWDRLGWGSKDIAELRSRLTSNTVMLTTLVSTCQVNVQKKLDKFKQECQDGKHEGSKVSTQTVESLSADEQQSWRTIRKDLEDIGISVEAFDTNKDFILNWFKTAISTGAFEEQTLETETSMLDEDDLSQSWEDPRRDTLLLLEDPETGSDLPSPSIKPQASKLSTETKGQRRRPPRVAGLLNWLFRNDTKLRKAVQSEGETKIQELLEGRVDINRRDDHGMTPLHHAVRSNSEVVVRLLLEKGAEILLRDQFRRTALHMAVEKEDHRESMAQLLLEKGSEINSKDMCGSTELHLAARSGDEKLVKLLLNHGAKIEEKDNDGYTALHLAIKAGNLPMVQLLLENGAVVVGKDRRELTLLHHAVRFKVESEALLMSQLLLMHGANPNETNDSGSVLLWAIEKGREEMVQNLLDYGAETNSKDTYGSTGLHLVATSGDENLVKLLLDHGAKIEEKDNNGSTALHSAVRAGHVTVAQLMLEHGAIPVGKDRLGLTLLHHAVRLMNGSEALLMSQLLLKHGANPNEMNTGSVLVWAAETGREEIVRNLLDHGAEVDKPDADGRTAIAAAAKCGYRKIVQILLDHGSEDIWHRSVDMVTKGLVAWALGWALGPTQS